MSPTPTPLPDSAPEPPHSNNLSLGQRFKKVVIGAPKDLSDRSLFHRVTLVPFLAWVGLGADGLSSSAYGPDEAFRTVGQHTYLLLALALLSTATVAIISSAYKRIIEEFPHGGGGYLVASKLLGRHAGLVSGCALLVDYVLTISVSIAAAGDAIFSFLPPAWHVYKLGAEIAFVAGLTVLNIRGVRESVIFLLPVFVVFLVSHGAGILWGILSHAGSLEATAEEAGQAFNQGLAGLGLGGMLLLLLHAYSMGGGTYTGIEAVSNGLPIMREPRAQTGKRTMTYMAASLAFTAAGLLICYLLWRVAPEEGKTMNAVLFERMAGQMPWGQVLVAVALVSEGALLVVAAQAGFLDGPRVLANMARDNWAPRRFAALSERLTTQNGIILMGACALMVLVYTAGDVRHLVVMYSINVFLTFTLSMLGMALLTLRTREDRPRQAGRGLLFLIGLSLCATVLVVTTLEKFQEGGWLTLVVTFLLVCLCLFIHAHYRQLGMKLEDLYRDLAPALEPRPRARAAAPLPCDSSKPTAVLLVAGFGGLGIHTMLNIFRAFPGHFSNLVIASVGVVDSGEFKGDGAVEALRRRTEETVQKYVEIASRLGVPAVGRVGIGTDVVQEADRLCLEIAAEFPQTMFFAGKIVFQRDRWYQRLLHNETAFAVQKRLQWAGKTMVILPAKVS